LTGFWQRRLQEQRPATPGSGKHWEGSQIAQRIAQQDFVGRFLYLDRMISGERDRRAVGKLLHCPDFIHVDDGFLAVGSSNFFEMSHAQPPLGLLQQRGDLEPAFGAVASTTAGNSSAGSGR
jgi:hypothetical protein